MQWFTTSIKARTLARRHGDDARLPNCDYLIGAAQLRLSRYPGAYSNLSSTFRHVGDDEVSRASILALLAELYRRTANYSRTYAACRDAIEIAERRDLPRLYVDFLLMRAITDATLSRYHSARTAIAFARQRNDQHGNRISGFIDLGSAGVADRYRDLALAVRSLEYNFGRGWDARLFDAYGIDRPDVEMVEFYQLLDEFF